MFVGRETLERFEAMTKFVGVHEVGKIAFELFVAVVAVTFAGRLPDGRFMRSNWAFARGRLMKSWSISSATAAPSFPAFSPATAPYHFSSAMRLEKTKMEEVRVQ